MFQAMLKSLTPVNPSVISVAIQIFMILSVSTCASHGIGKGESCVWKDQLNLDMAPTLHSRGRGRLCIQLDLIAPPSPSPGIENKTSHPLSAGGTAASDPILVPNAKKKRTSCPKSVDGPASDTQTVPGAKKKNMLFNIGCWS
jgi:hypothetical protein